jgi:hypothetical protein
MVIRFFFIQGMGLFVDHSPSEAVAQTRPGLVYATAAAVWLYGAKFID